MRYHWEVESSPFTPEIQNFAGQLNVPPVIARILHGRGISEFESARRFFRPNVTTLNDPFLMKGMEAAVERILGALDRRERILIFGDYDVDGTTATSLLHLFLGRLGADLDFYIPDRLREGYGLSMTGVREVHRRGGALIIAVDCGVTAIEQVDYARQLGIDVIVCDHHEPGDVLPEVTALLNPKQEGCDYPFKELAGVGVTFKLVQALAARLQLDPESYLQHLDLVALGTAADIVPLVEENRVFAKVGFARLVDAEKVGLAALLEVTGLRGRPLGTGQAVFVLAPRINAVGRMGDAGRAVRLLIAESRQTALNIAAILESENRQRRHVDEETFREAVEMVESEFDAERDCAFVLAKDGWHAGVIGIVASRVVEKYYRPTVMIAADGARAKGSARSVRGFDIYRALRRCQDLLSGYGGHKYAAGLTIETDHIPAFRDRLLEVAAAELDEDLLTRRLRIDAEIRFEDIAPRFIKLLDLMGPFGPQNMRPLFMSRELEVVGSPSIVGDNHLRLKVRQDGRIIDAIGFNLGDLQGRVSGPHKSVEMAYTLSENEWQGIRRVQLQVKDIR